MAYGGRGRHVTRCNTSALDIKEGEEWSTPTEFKQPAPSPSTQFFKSKTEKISDEMVAETWDVPMVNHRKGTSINYVEDKMFQSFLNRQDVFGKCKHKDKVATSHNCSLHKSCFLTCQDCSSFLGCKHCLSTKD